ncbi:sortase-dependent protein [Streptomyces sp. NPDC047000]|uniref:sortase-dependent protein n=1 Tax=Streptomyces sp. NPDC047000 TaxID=3155474 RepID=UPI0033F2957E
MRRTVFSALALTATAVLAGAAPAFADSGTPSPVPSTRASATAAPVPTTRPSTGASAAPVTEPTVAPSDRGASPAPARDTKGGQVSVVPKGAPDTGVAPESSGSGSTAGLIGGGAAAALVAGGGAFLVVRRRRATGA